MRRTGLGRHGGLDDASGDPLDGLVNLFDIGVVLAVAFLVAGLGLTIDQTSGRTQPRETPVQQRTVPEPGTGPQATGQGEAVGTVYRLSDGRLVLVEPGGTRRPLP